MRSIMLFSSNPNLLALILRDLDRAAAYLAVCVSSTKEREKRYADALLELAELSVDAAGSRIPPVEALVLGGDELKRLRAACESSELYKSTKAKMPVLKRLDLALRAKPEMVIKLMEANTPMSVEHVLPQKPPIDSQWMRDLRRSRTAYALAGQPCAAFCKKECSELQQAVQGQEK